MEGQWHLRNGMDEYLSGFDFMGKRVLEIGPASFDPLIGLFMGGVSQENQFTQDGVIAPAIWESRTKGMRWQL